MSDVGDRLGLCPTDHASTNLCPTEGTAPLRCPGRASVSSSTSEGGADTSEGAPTRVVDEPKVHKLPMQIALDGRPTRG
jgi:hypothetical protein